MLLYGQDDDGITRKVRVSDTGALLTTTGDISSAANPDYFGQVVEGFDPDRFFIQKFGRNPVIDTATVPEDIWNGGSLYTGFNCVAAQTLQVFSASANDTAAGTGARTVMLSGLDGSFNPITETVTMNGTSIVTTVQSFIRMDRAIVLTSGTGLTNAGAITARQSSTTANVCMVMPQGAGQTAICATTIPDGYTGYVKSMNVELNDAGSTRITGRLVARPPGGAWNSKRFFSAAVTDSYNRNFPGIALAARTDITIRILSSSSNGADVTGAFDILCVRDQ